MARIAGVTIPDNKQVLISLTYVYGIGLKTSEKLLDDLKIDPTARVKDLTEAEMEKIRNQIGSMTVEGDAQRIVQNNIKRLKDIKSYRGGRHRVGLPTRGQRTKTNARTKRGRKVAVSGAQPKAATKT